MRTKKELKKAYKQLKFRMGIFQIRNTVNGKIFIESSVNLDAIWNRHRFQLNFGSHPNKALQEDWNTFGEEKFCFEILSELDEQEDSTANHAKELKTLEAMFIEELTPYGDKGYHSRAKTA